MVRGYRFLCDIGRNLIIEFESKLIKIPNQFTRAPNRDLGEELDSSTQSATTENLHRIIIAMY